MICNAAVKHLLLGAESASVKDDSLNNNQLYVDNENNLAVSDG